MYFITVNIIPSVKEERREREKGKIFVIWKCHTVQDPGPPMSSIILFDFRRKVSIVFYSFCKLYDLCWSGLFLFHLRIPTHPSLHSPRTSHNLPLLYTIHLNFTQCTTTTTLNSTCQSSQDRLSHWEPDSRLGPQLHTMDYDHNIKFNMSVVSGQTLSLRTRFTTRVHLVHSSRLVFVRSWVHSHYVTRF